MTCLDAYGNTVYYLTQWDMNQKLYITGSMLTEAPMLHFQNKNTERALEVQSSIGDDGTISADVPNRLLMEPYPITAYIYATKGNSSKAVWQTTIPVRKRVKPEGFLYGDNIGETADILKELRWKIKEMQTQIEEISGMLEGNVVVDKDTEPSTPDTPNENIPEGFWGSTVDIYLDATSSNLEGGETKETAIQANHTKTETLVTALANKAQNVNIHIVNVGKSVPSIPLDLDIKHDRIITFDYMEGCGSGKYQETESYPLGVVAADITFPLVGEYTNCVITSNGDWDAVNLFSKTNIDYPIFHSCNIDVKGHLRLIASSRIFSDGITVTQCDNCNIVCENFRYAQSSEGKCYAEMKDTSLTVMGNWHLWGYGGVRVSPYLFTSCTVKIHELKLTYGHPTEDGFFDGTGSKITIENITRADGLNRKYTSKGIQNFILPSEWELKTSNGESKTEIYNLNGQKVTDAKKVATTTINNMIVTSSTTAKSIEALVKNALADSGISGVTVTCTLRDSGFSDYIQGEVKVSIEDINETISIWKNISQT